MTLLISKNSQFEPARSCLVNSLSRRLVQKAPVRSKDILDAYKKHKGDWTLYEEQFLNLMRSRRIEEKTSPKMLDTACLLCSEEKPHHCHRRLVAEYLKEKWGNVEIEHLP